MVWYDISQDTYLVVLDEILAKTQLRLWVQILEGGLAKAGFYFVGSEIEWNFSKDTGGFGMRLAKTKKFLDEALAKAKICLCKNKALFGFL